MSDDLDREIARVKVDAATHRERESLRLARRAEAEWLSAVSADEGVSVAQHRYWRADLELSNARFALAQARADLSASIADSVA